MDLIKILERLELNDMRDEVKEARAEVEEQERTVANLNQQLNQDMSKEHKARSNNDQEAAQRFARHAERRRDDLRREKEALKEIRDERGEVEKRIRNLLRDALEQAM